jgi:ketosteroid isomerase-like protein
MGGGIEAVSRTLLRELKRAWEAGDAEAVARLYSEKALFQDGVGREEKIVRGRKAIENTVREMFQLPGARFEVTSLSSTPEGGFAEWTYSWRATKHGRRHGLRGASVIFVRRGRVVREASYYNSAPELV